MLKLGITEKNELVGMEFNFGAHSLTFCVNLKMFQISPVGVLKAGRKSLKCFR